ncbi:MAG: hypothetical protein ABI637_04895 [Gemmatimonadota bacterium]
MKLYWDADAESAPRILERGFEDLAPDDGQATATPRGLLVWAEPTPGAQLTPGWVTIETDITGTAADLAPFRHPHSELPDAVCYWVPAELLNGGSRRALD